MKVAIISDIHANISALSEVLNDIEKRNCDAVFCLGDYVGYYYWPNEVLSALRRLESAFFIKGNHEYLYFDALENEVVRSEIKQKYGLGIEYAIDSLSEENIFFLKTLDDSTVVDFSGVKFGMYHGSPSKVDEYVYPDADIKKFSNLSNVDVDVILLGHTHHQYSTQIKNKLIINPGSVGQARDIKGLASYSVLNLQNMVTTSLRLPYDKSGIVQIIKNVEVNKSKMLRALLNPIDGNV